jgi:hypothetical protein
VRLIELLIDSFPTVLTVLSHIRLCAIEFWLRSVDLHLEFDTLTSYTCISSVFYFRRLLGSSRSG